MEHLTKREQEVFDLLGKEFLTKKQILSRLKISRQAVEKHIRNIRLKGYLNFGVAKSNFIQSTQATNTFSPNKIRLHSQEWNIQILTKTKQYEAIRKRINHIKDFDGNFIRLYKDSVEVYGKKSFLGITPQEATSLAMDYWNSFMVRLENELCISILKPRYQNIKLVNQHYAETNNELAKEQERQDIRTKVYTNDDGKLWFLIDNSFNLHEAETTHPYTAKQDIEKLQGFFNDLRDNPPTKMSELLGIMKNLAEYQKESFAGLSVLIKLLGGVPNTSDTTSDNSNKEPPPSYVG